ncbi:MAG TPA: hypothetical protein VKY74_21990 [Chloroflexia bacterium]|nr:hypothetical protein [Chloroflexia bacterium]
MITHLGRDAFFEKRYPAKRCRAPQFTFEQVSFGRPIEVVMSDPVTETIPDAQCFVQEAPLRAEALVQRFHGQLDYSVASLNPVDSFILKKSYRHADPWAKEHSRLLLQELVAYYGEVLRRNLEGRWDVVAVRGGNLHPVVICKINGHRHVEYPVTRIAKFWLGRERADGLAVRLYLLQSGEWRRLEQYIKSADQDPAWLRKARAWVDGFVRRS